MDENINLRIRFKQGLIDRGFNPDDIIKNWKYCGGDTENKDKNYFKTYFKNIEVLIDEKEEYCVCGHAITNNCYITNDEEILVIGSCCIKKFIKNKTRTCEKCNEPHNNRACNRCNNCRKGVCDKCDEKYPKQYKYCWSCRYYPKKNLK